MLTIDGVSKTYTEASGRIPVLRHINLYVEKGQVLGLVGESGAGKSTLGRCILGMERPDCGRIEFQGVDLTDLGGNDFHQLYRRIQMIFQDPYTYLNPYMRVGELVQEPLENFTGADRTARKQHVLKMLGRVGLPPAITDRYPHQISGGQCQRVAIARALIIQPELLICDEALSAQDAPLQLQILKLLQHLIQKMKLTCLFITHDLIVARYFCSHIAVIHKGRIVEQGKAMDVFTRPAKAYTRWLVSSILPLSTVSLINRPTSDSSTALHLGQ